MGAPWKSIVPSCRPGTFALPFSSYRPPFRSKRSSFCCLAGPHRAFPCKGSQFLPPAFSVAPMMDYTDNHFRTLARLLTQHAWLYTEMVVADTIVHQEKNLDRFLDFPESQHPIVLQIGGSNISTLANAARLASAYGYDEINLNCGCPSDKVAGHGCFGARLMLEPTLVGHSMAAIAENCDVPVSVKCRIGVDDAESYDELCTFIDTVSNLSPTRHFIVHARKAILKGISPAANRKIPPLKYEYVYALIRDFPHLKFTLNGGITSIQQAKMALQLGAYGVMVGRASCSSPWSLLAHVDNAIYGTHTVTTSRREILASYQNYADSVIRKYGPGRPSLRHTIKPLLHLFHGEQGAGIWRRALDAAFRECKTCSDLLNTTLNVIPDDVLDAPLSALELDNDQSQFSVASELPSRSSSTKCQNSRSFIEMKVVECA